MKKILSNLLDWIYKKKCYLCGSSKEGIKMCSSCYEQMEHLPVQKDREFFGCEVYSAGVYENSLQKLIRGLKYHNQRDLAYFQAKFMYEYWKQILDKKDNYQIVPIPLYHTREKDRKYNHMTLVAQEFSKLTGYEVNTELVKRIKDTMPQYKLNKNQRMDNLSNAFSIHKEKLLACDVLLIDDICTTGSTFENIIKELKANDINNILCFATTTPFNNGEN